MRQQLQAMQIYATLKHANNAIVMQIYAIHLNACKRIFNIKLKAMMARVSSLGHWQKLLEVLEQSKCWSYTSPYSSTIIAMIIIVTG